MPIYEFRCDCGREKEKMLLMKDSETSVLCECGQTMYKIISLPSTDLVNNVRYSNSMGVNPKRITEMERKYPGSRYTPDGRLIVNSRKDKLKKIKERRMAEIE